MSDTVEAENNTAVGVSEIAEDIEEVGTETVESISNLTTNNPEVIETKVDSTLPIDNTTKVDVA